MSTKPRKTLLIKRRLDSNTLRNDIANEFNPADPHPRDHGICNRWRTDYPRAVPRTNAPSYGYNCHGLTFAARRTQIWSSEEVRLLLQEDGYKEVSQKDAYPGDIIVYYSIETGEIELH